MRRHVDVFVIRQVLLEIAVCLTSYTTGMILAFTPVLNRVVLAPDSEIEVTPDQASWIDTYLSLGGLLGSIFLPIVFKSFGRKMANIVTNLFILIGSLLLYVANDVYSLAFARLTQGLTIGGIFINGIALCECISPKRRGYFMVLNKFSFGLGSMTSHTSRFISWRQIALIGLLGNVASIIIFMISAESPSFLARQGQFDKCTESFTWYRGISSNSKEEIQKLISAQRESLKMKEINKNTSIFNTTKIILMSKQFQKSLFIVTLSILCLDSSETYFALTYITQTLSELTKDTSLAVYTTVATYLILILALAISSFLVKHFKRRTLLFKLGCSSELLMFMVSFVIILRSQFYLLPDVKWLTPTLILLGIFITNIGVVPLTYVLTGEIFSLEHRALGSSLSGVTYVIIFNLIRKSTPIMLDKIGIEGTYFIYGLLLHLFFVLLRLTLPETKDKTLQQIEDELKGIVRNDTVVELLIHHEGNHR